MSITAADGLHLFSALQVLAHRFERGRPALLAEGYSQLAEYPFSSEGVREAQTELTISMFLADGQVGNDITSHPGSRTTTWMTFGNQVDAANITGSSVQSVAHWYALVHDFCDVSCEL